MKKFLLGAVALASAAMPAIAQDGQDRAVRVINYSNSQYIVDVTITNEHGRTYDALPTYITPGYNRVLSFDDGEGHGHCNYLVTATFQNGVMAQRNMNVCVTTNWNIYDIDNTVD